MDDSKLLFGAASVHATLLGPDFGVCVVHVLATVVVVVFTPVLILVVFAEDHFLAARGVLGHVNVGVTEVVVVAARGLVSLVVEGAFLVFDGVAGGAGGEGEVTLVVGAVDVVLLCHLAGERVVVGQSRRVHRVVFRRSVLKIDLMLECERIRTGSLPFNIRVIVHYLAV